MYKHNCNPREAFKEVIYSSELVEYFKRLACYKSESLLAIF